MPNKKKEDESSGFTEEDLAKMGQGITGRTFLDRFPVTPVPKQKPLPERYIYDPETGRYIDTLASGTPLIPKTISPVAQMISGTSAQNTPEIKATPPLTQNTPPPVAPPPTADLSQSVITTTKPGSTGKEGQALEKEKEKIYNEQKAVIAANAALDISEQNQINQEQQAYNAERLKEAQAAQVRMDERLKLTQDAMNDLRTAQDNFASSKVDPNHFWSDRTPPEKITAIIAIALGAAGSALAGTPQINPALRIIERAIDLDIDAQKTALMQKGDIVSQKRNLLSDLEKTSRSEQERDSQAKILKYEAFKDKINEIASRSKLPKILLSAKSLTDEISLRENAEKMKGVQNRAGSVEEKTIEGGGKPTTPKSLTESERKVLAGIKSNLSNLNVLEQKFNDAGIFAGLFQYLPATKAGAYKAFQKGMAIDLSFIINNANELGLGSKEDVLDLLPYAGDGQKKAAEKLSFLRTMLRNKAAAWEELGGMNTQRTQSSSLSSLANSKR